MLQSVLKSKFGYDSFKNDIQKQATTAIHKGFYEKLIFFMLGLQILSVHLQYVLPSLEKIYNFFFNEYIYQIRRK